MRRWLGGAIWVLLCACRTCDPAPPCPVPTPVTSAWMVPVGSYPSSDRATAGAVFEVLESLRILWVEEGSLATTVFVPVERADQVAAVLECHPKVAGKIATIPKEDRSGAFQYNVPLLGASAPK